MARSVTIASIIAKARVYADMRNSDFINAAEALAMFNDIWPELYDELVSAYENYYATSEEIPLVSGDNVYDLPDDFYKLIGVDFKVGTGSYVTLKPFMESERNGTLSTNLTVPAGTIRIRYVPAPPIYTDVTDEVDGVAGWDRLVALLLAMEFLDAEESDTSSLSRRYVRTLERIRSMAAPRDAGMPARVTDINQANWQGAYGSLKYRLYGDTVELLNTEWLGTVDFD